MINTRDLEPQQSERAADIWRTCAAAFHEAAAQDCSGHRALVTRDDDPDFARDTAFMAMVFLDSYAGDRSTTGPFIALNRTVAKAMIEPTPNHWQAVHVETIHAVAHLVVQMINMTQGTAQARQWTQEMINRFAVGDWPAFEMPS